MRSQSKFTLLFMKQLISLLSGKEERGCYLQTLVKKEPAWIYILMEGIWLWDIGANTI